MTLSSKNTSGCNVSKVEFTRSPSLNSVVPVNTRTLVIKPQKKKWEVGGKF